MKRRLAKAQVKRAQDAAARRVEAAEGRARKDLQTWIDRARVDLKDRTAGEIAAAFQDAMTEVGHYSQGGQPMRVRMLDGRSPCYKANPNPSDCGPEPMAISLLPLQVLAVWQLLAQRLGIPQPYLSHDAPGQIRVAVYPPHRLVAPACVLKV